MTGNSLRHMGHCWYEVKPNNLLVSNDVNGTLAMEAYIMTVWHRSLF